jgi:hypothetical protein
VFGLQRSIDLRSFISLLTCSSLVVVSYLLSRFLVFTVNIVDSITNLQTLPYPCKVSDAVMIIRRVTALGLLKFEKIRCDLPVACSTRVRWAQKSWAEVLVRSGRRLVPERLSFCIRLVFSWLIRRSHGSLCWSRVLYFLGTLPRGINGTSPLEPSGSCHPRRSY